MTQYIKILNIGSTSLIFFVSPLAPIWLSTAPLAKKVIIVTDKKQNHFNITLVPLLHFFTFLSHGNKSLIWSPGKNCGLRKICSLQLPALSVSLPHIPAISCCPLASQGHTFGHLKEISHLQKQAKLCTSLCSWVTPKQE